jgi:hypothetical protein
MMIDWIELSLPNILCFSHYKNIQSLSIKQRNALKNRIVLPAAGGSLSGCTLVSYIGEP